MTSTPPNTHVPVILSTGASGRSDSAASPLISRPPMTALPLSITRISGGTVIENEAFLIEADPAKGGTLSRILDKRSGRELLSGQLSDVFDLVNRDSKGRQHPVLLAPWTMPPMVIRKTPVSATTSPP